MKSSVGSLAPQGLLKKPHLDSGHHPHSARCSSMLVKGTYILAPKPAFRFSSLEFLELLLSQMPTFPLSSSRAKPRSCLFGKGTYCLPHQAPHPPPTPHHVPWAPVPLFSALFHLCTQVVWGCSRGVMQSSVLYEEPETWVCAQALPLPALLLEASPRPLQLHVFICQREKPG